jgi:hypothetical protein
MSGIKALPGLHQLSCFPKLLALPSSKVIEYEETKEVEE